jgi:hypothetical protein
MGRPKKNEEFKTDAAGAVTPEVSSDDIVVEEHEVPRAQELPLVITPKSGSWKNTAQAKYAAVLNAYYYSNPKKWAKKKASLLKNLAILGDDPSQFARITGEQEQMSNNLTFRNRMIDV